jgi:hypothetical protein
MLINQVLGDQFGGANPTGEQYGYEACTRMRQNHIDLAPTNPDSIALYALGKSPIFELFLALCNGDDR